jgi:hypothetical protein
MWGRSRCTVKGVHLICQNSQLGGGKYLSVSQFLSYIYLLLLNSSRIFLIRIAAARIKLCPCRYFAVAKNPRDYSSYAVQQLQSAGRCEQGAAR